MNFIKRHWIAYVIAALIAIGMGAAAAYVIGVKASTPSDTRTENIAAEKKNAEFVDTVENGPDDEATNAVVSGSGVE